MAKVSGNIRINAKPESDGVPFHFEVAFMPHAGRLSTRTVKVGSFDELVSFLMNLRIDEDEATRWAGKARSQGVVLIAAVERTEMQLKESGLLA